MQFVSACSQEQATVTRSRPVPSLEINILASLGGARNFRVMLINHLCHFILLGVFARRFLDGGSAASTFTNDTLARSGRDVGIKYLVFPEGSNVQVR